MRRSLELCHTRKDQQCPNRPSPFCTRAASSTSTAATSSSTATYAWSATAITAVTADKSAAGDADELIELPDLTLIPGLMDMEVDLVLGGPGAGLNDPVQTDPVKMTLRGAANARRTLLAGFTTVRNLGLFVKTSGYLLDVALAHATDAGWIDGPRIVPAGHAIVPTGGHLDPSAQSGLAPHIMPLSVEEGIADGIDQVRRAVRYQIKHGAKLIKCCASGGVISPTGPSGAQQYSTEELAAIADEAHRRGLKVATHCSRRHRRQRRDRRRHRLHRARLHDQRTPRSSGWSTPVRSWCPRPR